MTNLFHNLHKKQIIRPTKMYENNFSGKPKSAHYFHLKGNYLFIGSFAMLIIFSH